MFSLLNSSLPRKDNRGTKSNLREGGYGKSSLTKLLYISHVNVTDLSFFDVSQAQRFIVMQKLTEKN